MAALLDVRDLRVSLPSPSGPLEIVRGLDLRVDDGRMLALVGESGSGKSLAVSALLDLAHEHARIDFAEFTFAGRPIARPELRSLRGKDIAMVFQDASLALDPMQTVGDALVETLRRHAPLSRAAAREQALQLLREVGIPEPESRLHAAPHQLSGGQRQRVTLALALASRPKLLLLDEATTALDPTLRLALLATLDQLRRDRGLGIVFVTHDLGLAAHAADEVAVLYAGRIVECGPKTEVLAAPRHPYTRGLVDSLPRLGSTADALPAMRGHVPPVAEWPEGCGFAPRCARATEACGKTPALIGTGPHRFACHHPLGGDP